MGPVLALPIVINGVAISSFGTVGGAVAGTAVIVAVAAIPGAAAAVNRHQRNGGSPVDFAETDPIPPPNPIPPPVPRQQQHQPGPPFDDSREQPREESSPPRTATRVTHRDVTPAVQSAIRAHWSDIERAAANHNLDPYIVAGVISRESNGGHALDKKGEGDRGRAFGVMQVDYKHSGLAKVEGGDPWSAAHLDQGCKVLREKMDGVAKAHPDWSAEEKLKGGVAAYNVGVGNVRTVEGIDRGTTGNNYGSDTLARAEAIRSQQQTSSNK